MLEEDLDLIRREQACKSTCGILDCNHGCISEQLRTQLVTEAPGPDRAISVYVQAAQEKQIILDERNRRDARVGFVK